MTILYPSDRSVSIWVGTFEDDDAFDAAAEDDVEAQLKLPVPLASITEAAFEGDPVPTQELLEGFSGWETFIADALRAAKLKQVSRANAVLVCYQLRCEAAPDAWGELTFLGTFPGPEYTVNP